MGKLIYRDSCGSYSITAHKDGTATLRCRNSANYNLDVNKRYKSVLCAKRALSRYCDGMPELVSN